MVLIGRRDLRSNNSWMHNLDLLVKGPPVCTMMIHPDDAARLGLTSGELARVTSEVGSLEIAAQLTDAIMPGVISIPLHPHQPRRASVKYGPIFALNAPCWRGASEAGMPNLFRDGPLAATVVHVAKQGPKDGHTDAHHQPDHHFYGTARGCQFRVGGQVHVVIAPGHLQDGHDHYGHPQKANDAAGAQ
ncbi:hypothetical protein IV102_33080 [bacterium]|nr:hypothetical protein [bacterium]